MTLLILGTLLVSRDKIRQLTLCLAHPLMHVGHHARVMRLIWMKTDVFEIYEAGTTCTYEGGNQLCTL